MSAAQVNLRIRIEDVGPIREAEITLAPLTVLVGPSGSGKSYAAAIIDSLATAPRFAGIALSETIAESEYAQQLSAVVEKLVPLVDLGVARAVTLGTSTASDRKKFLTWLKKVYMAAGGVCNLFAPSLAVQCWQTSPGKLPPRHRGSVPRVTCSFPGQPNLPRSNSTVIYAPIVFAPPSEGRLLHVPELARLLANYLNIPAEAQKDFDPRAHLCVAALQGAFRNAADSFGDHTWLLPAGRAGLWHARRLATAGSLRSGGGSAAVRQVLQFFMVLTKLDPGVLGPLAGVADEIEQSVHGGKMRVKYSPGALPDVHFLQGELAIPLDRASSSVTELAPITLWLRHFIRPGALLIIEEPEAHLHPTKQLALAEALARLVRAGVRLVITTHSDLLLRKLGAVVMKTALADRADPKREIGDWDLRPDDLAVYRFSEHSEGGFVTQQEPVDLAYGIDTEELSKVEEELYEERGALRDRLGNLDEEKAP